MSFETIENLVKPISEAFQVLTKIKDKELGSRLRRCIDERLGQLTIIKDYHNSIHSNYHGQLIIALMNQSHPYQHFFFQSKGSIIIMLADPLPNGGLAGLEAELRQLLLAPALRQCRRIERTHLKGAPTVRVRGGRSVRRRGSRDKTKMRVKSRLPAPKNSFFQRPSDPSCEDQKIKEKGTKHKSAGLRTGQGRK